MEAVVKEKLGTTRHTTFQNLVHAWLVFEPEKVESGVLSNAATFLFG